MAAVIEPDDIDWTAYEADSEPRSKVRPASAWGEELIAAMGRDAGPVGDRLPWGKTHADVRFRRGEVTIWAGANGSGKSLMLGQVMLGLMSQGCRCMIASFEMKPRVTLARMLRQAAGGNRPTPEFARRMFGWTDDLLWLYDQQGTVSADRVLAVLRYSAAELKCAHLVVDSMMKCVRGEDDYNGQKDLVDALTAFARDTDTHVHLVHHMRKGDESKPGSKYDLKGSGSITDQADNVFVVWRDKAKERARQCGQEVDDSKPDALLLVEKQRNGEGPEAEARWALWFDQSSTQFLGAHRGSVQEYVA